MLLPVVIEKSTSNQNHSTSNEQRTKLKGCCCCCCLSASLYKCLCRFSQEKSGSLNCNPIQFNIKPIQSFLFYRKANTFTDTLLPGSQNKSNHAISKRLLESLTSILSFPFPSVCCCCLTSAFHRSFSCLLLTLNWGKVCCWQDRAR